MGRTIWRLASKPRRRTVEPSPYHRRLLCESLEDRRLLAVILNYAGPGSVLNLAENTSGATPAIAISQTDVGSLKIDLGTGNVFTASSTASATGLTYQNTDSPQTSEYATIDVGTPNNVSRLNAALAGDGLVIGPISDNNSGIGGIAVSAATIEVTAGINTSAANVNVDLKATGNLTVDNGAVIETGNGLLSLAADVKADGTGDDGVGTLAVGAGAAVTSANTAADAITLRGATINIDTSANPAVVGGAQRSLSTTPGANVIGGIDAPDALAFDSKGNLFVANYGGDTVSEFAPGRATPTATLTGLNLPDALAFDSKGNLFVANGGGMTVSEFAPGSITPTATLTGLNVPDALAFDSKGNLFVANDGGTTVSEFASGSTTPAATLTGLNVPDALAFDGKGNLFVANYGNNTVSEFVLGSATPTATLTGLDDPNALAFDSKGNLYVVNGGSDTVSEFAPGSTTPTATLTGPDDLDALAIDSKDNLGGANHGNSNADTVNEFAPGRRHLRQ